MADSLERYVILPRPRHSVAQHRTKHVVAEVSRRTGFRFHYTRHTSAARKLGAWPAEGQPNATMDEQLAEYNSAFKGWLYSQNWIDLLVERLSSADDFRTITGHEAIPPATAPSES